MNRAAGSAAVISIGIVSLAAAMGIGRFAFTPLLPLMMRDGTLDAAAGADWAAANYLGYLLGAWSAPRLSRDIPRSIRLALAGIALATLLAAFVEASWAGIVLRLAAGVFSAWVLVLASSWCLAEFARRSEAHLGAWIYTGVGAGIAIAGAIAWVGGLQPARLLWLELGAIAALAAGYVFSRMPRSERVAPAVHDNHLVKAHGGHFGLVFCYGAFGFGYIIPATFLPALARSQVADPLVFGLTWPVFGLAAMFSIAIAARSLVAHRRRTVWAGAQALMAVGTALPVLSHDLGALALSAVFVGGTFMVATMAGLQLARELTPQDPTPLLARMTTAFAVGQIVGPVLVRGLQAVPLAGQDATSVAGAAAALVLAATAAWLWLGESAPEGRKS